MSQEVDEIVAWLERRIKDGANPVYLPATFATSLLSAYRAQQASLEQAAAALEPFIRLTGDLVAMANTNRLDGDDGFEDSDSAGLHYGWALGLIWGDLRRAAALAQPKPER